MLQWAPTQVKRLVFLPLHGAQNWTSELIRDFQFVWSSSAQFRSLSPKPAHHPAQCRHNPRCTSQNRSEEWLQAGNTKRNAMLSREPLMETHKKYKIGDLRTRPLPRNLKCCPPKAQRHEYRNPVKCRIREPVCQCCPTQFNSAYRQDRPEVCCPPPARLCEWKRQVRRTSYRGEDRFSRASNARDKGRRLLMPGHMLRVTLSAKMKDLQLGWSWVVAVSVMVDLTAVPLRVSFVLVVCICFF